MLGCLDTFLFGQPNVNHEAIAKLASEGRTGLILTTNFDTFIEDALGETNCKYETYLNSAPERPFPVDGKSGKHQLPPLVKPHGSLQEAASIIVTLRQAGRQLSSGLTDLLKHTLSSCIVLVIGYSGNDDDIFPVLDSSAKSAKSVYWYLRSDGKTLKDEPNVATFAEHCPNCKLVKAGGKDLLPLLTTARLAGEGLAVTKINERRTQRLAQWATGFSSSAWTNSLCELLLLVGPEDGSPEDSVKGDREWQETLGLVAHRSQRIVYLGKDQPWIIARALRNCGIALLTQGQREKGARKLTAALEQYMLLGRPREIVEMATAIVETRDTPVKEEDDPITMASRFVQDDYSQGLFGLATGLDLLRGSKFVGAEKFLLIAAGYALKAGDTVTLRKVVFALEKLYLNPAAYKCEVTWRQQLPMLRTKLDAFGTADSTEHHEILAPFLNMAKEHKQLLMRLEAAACIGITVVFYLLALAIWRSPVGAIKYGFYGALAFALSRILRFVKRRRYVDIDRA